MLTATCGPARMHAYLFLMDHPSFALHINIAIYIVKSTC